MLISVTLGALRPKNCIQKFKKRFYKRDQIDVEVLPNFHFIVLS